MSTLLLCLSSTTTTGEALRSLEARSTWRMAVCDSEDFLGTMPLADLCLWIASEHETEAVKDYIAGAPVFPWYGKRCGGAFGGSSSHSG